MKTNSLTLVILSAFVISIAGSSDAQGSRRKAQRRRTIGFTSKSLDSLAAKELRQLKKPAGEPINDHEFLRRVYLDTIGRIPSLEEIEQFDKLRNKRKRPELVTDLTNRREYAEFWAWFWTDVITMRTRGEDDHLKVNIFHQWLTNHIEESDSWQRVVTEMITATGRNDQSGPSNYILAQMARPGDLGSETARVFMGIRLQCAECHDDPEGIWTRRQFHELAAFFGKIDELRVEPEVPLEPKRPGLPPPNPPFRIVQIDATWKEYVMADAVNPLRGLPILQPRALSGPPLPKNLSDMQRRTFLATWVTGKQNEWFPRAHINRVWNKLFGSGFAQDVDDMGPGRKLTSRTALYRLALAWMQSGYDNRWLLQLIMNSNVYQSRRTVGKTAFSGVATQQLTSRQLLSSLRVALSIDEHELPEEFEEEFLLLFEEDPSVRPEHVATTVSHALMLMNNPLVDSFIQAKSRQLITKVSLGETDPIAVAQQLYLVTLTRLPTQRETALFRDFIAEVGDPLEASEDLLWCLINSHEFISKR